MCSVQVEVGNQNLASWNGRVFVANRNDGSVSPTYFSPFAPVTGPQGNPGIGFTNQPTGIPNVFGFSEATLRRRGDFEVHVHSWCPS